MILDQQNHSSEFDQSTREKVREVLLKKHHHQNEKKRNNLLPIVLSFADKPGEGSYRAKHWVQVPVGFDTR